MIPSRWIAATALIAGLVLHAAARPLDAQETRGTVRDSTSRIAIPGAVVSLLDSTGRAIARTITNQRGEFRAVLTSDVRRIQVVRLGFRPRTVRAPRSPAEGARLDVAMTPLPTFLQPVHVEADTRCSRRPDRLMALALLEQARTGLLATIVARSEHPARMTRLHVRRTIDRPGGRIVRHEVRIDSGSVSTGSFEAARGATDFVREGFRGDSSGHHIYFAPDAEVLLKDEFSSGYCFHIMEPTAPRANQVGLGFRPAERRTGRIDVAGALWIDTVARALVDIEYDYLGLDARTEPFEPGGRIFFRDMGNGVVLIDRWFIRFVAPRQDSATGPSPGVVAVAARPRARPPALVLVAVEGGGELARATWPDGHSWRASLGTLRLRLVTRENTPAVGALVRLPDTDYQATADSAGFVEIPDLAPGPYAVHVADSRLVPLDIMVPTPFGFVAARDSVVSSVVLVPSAADYTADRCERTHGHEARGTARLIGRVVGPDGHPIRDARWTLRWQLSGAPIVYDAPVAPDGVFVYCNLSRGDALRLEVGAPGMAGALITPALSDRVTVVRVELKPR